MIARTLLLCFLLVSFPAIAADIKIDDVSRLNETVVSAIRSPTSESDIQQAVRDAVTTHKEISIAGRRHSQGGQIMTHDAIVLDMMSFNKIIGLNDDNSVLTVQSGATWAQVQDYLNSYGLAVKVQQSSNIFTVGGSLSVNAHGRDPRFGAIIETVRSFCLVTADGNIINVSRDENGELFKLAIGGYGLFGVITEVQLETTENAVLEKSTREMACNDYPAYLRDTVLNNKSIELHYVRPDIRRDRFMKDCSVTSYSKIASHPDRLSKLDQERLVATSKWLLNLSRKSDFGKKVRWFIQDEILDAPGKVQVLTRNNAMRPPAQFLDYHGVKDTDVLQEYFVPLHAAKDFMADLQKIVARDKINILSVTLRYVKADRESVLSYSPQDTLAFVLYINHGRDKVSVDTAGIWTRKLIDAALKRGGTYYLPYANYASTAQITAAYPSLPVFFDKKKHYDPSMLFSNKFYEKYSLAR